MRGDAELIQIADAAMAEAVRRGGSRIACRVGCTACCLGPFPISETDAVRLRSGMDALEPDRAARVRARAERYGEGDDEPCPALDPDTGACELYAWRPLTCRLFGPPVRSGSGATGMCELCFEGASDEEISACAVDIDPALMDQPEDTTVARALACRE